jgi:hypothetical protein
MEYITNQNDIEKRKSQARSWLFDWLSKIETCDNIIGEKSEMGNVEKVTLLFNTSDPPISSKDGK